MSKKQFKDLIILQTEDGKTHKLWDLVKASHDKRLQANFDYDYIQALREQMDSPDAEKAAEARNALVTLNAYCRAELGGNFDKLEELGFEVTAKLKKEITNLRDSAQRDFVLNNDYGRECLTDFIEESFERSTIGQMVDNWKSIKRKTRKAGKVLSEVLAATVKKNDESKPLPVKTFSKDEIAKLSVQYFKTKK